MAGNGPRRAYKVRFRHTACPPSASKPSDFSKYEFFFDKKQPWISPGVGLSFVDETENFQYELHFNEIESNTRSSPQQLQTPKSIRRYGLSSTETAPVSGVSKRLTAVDVDSPNSDAGIQRRDLKPLSAVQTFQESSAATCRASNLPTYIPSPDPTVDSEIFNTTADVSSERSGRATQRWEWHDRSEDEANVLPNNPPAVIQLSIGNKEAVSTRPASPHRDLPPWPFNIEQQASLFKHFIQVLSPWFNVTDRHRHFTTVVPRMAATSPVLMFAICAVSALHLSRTASFDECEPILYHDQCLQRLLPALDDEKRTGDDDLLATTVVLRLYEELDVDGAGNDEERHLFGTSLFIRIPKSNNSSSTSPFRKTCFWIHLRQEVYVAFVKQRGIHADLNDPVFHPSVALSDDVAWSDRIVALCAQVLQWAFGGNASVDGWLELHKAIDRWEQFRPETFEALFYRPEDPKADRWFPEIWFSDDEHVHCSKYYHLSKLVLAIHDPTLPKMGPRARQAASAVEEQVLHRVRTLCGIALSNKFPPVMHSACVVIIVCCNWFTVRAEQEELINVLRMGARSGWQIEAALKTLVEEWKLNSSEND